MERSISRSIILPQKGSKVAMGAVPSTCRGFPIYLHLEEHCFPFCPLSIRFSTPTASSPPLPPPCLRSIPRSARRLPLFISRQSFATTAANPSNSRVPTRRATDPSRRRRCTTRRPCSPFLKAERHFSQPAIRWPFCSSRNRCRRDR